MVAAFCMCNGRRRRCRVTRQPKTGSVFSERKLGDFFFFFFFKHCILNEKRKHEGQFSFSQQGPQTNSYHILFSCFVKASH